MKRYKYEKITKEQFKKLIDRQRELDEIILAKHTDEIDLVKHTYGKYPKLKLMARALLDEFGELNHETKAEWCWWKDTQKPVDRDRILEELVDCLHFALMILEYSYTEDAFDENYDECVSWAFDNYKIRTWEHLVRMHNELYKECSYNIYNNGLPLSSAVIASRIKASMNFICTLLAWGEINYGFTLDQMIEAYFKKSEINVNRVESGY